ncbi:MAG: hypothetical protein HZC36_10650 [Armatimonadetes bacterium]|nr:hypothetical protein [Armatimonadota bacterium]
MGSAYTPGLTVSGDVIVRRVRRLPIRGEVLVKIGDPIQPDTVVARALLPGILQTIKFAELYGIEPRDVPSQFPMKVGQTLAKDQVILETKGFLGMGKKTIASAFAGTIESISEVTGNVLVREDPIPIDVTGYVTGKIAEVLPEEGAIVETRGAMAQGIFGVGGETTGTIHVAVGSHDQVLKADNIHAEDKGKVLIGGAGMTLDAMQRASEVGVAGIVAGGLRDQDLIQFLGYDIGVAITGQEAINVTLMVTEGFGFLPMAKRTFELFLSLEGKRASMNGATQIRAGVIRPEVIVPLEQTSAMAQTAQSGGELTAGTPIRVIREPYFGQLGTVTDLPATLQVVESGTHVRVLKARLDDGQEVMVPRANVEIIAG